MDDCFRELHAYAQSHNRRLHEVARDVIRGTIPARAFAPPPKPEPG